MPRDKFCHSDCQKKVCFICFLKKKTMKNISEATYGMIRRLIVPEISLGLKVEHFSWLPSVICSNCLTSIFRLNKDQSISFTSVDYSEITSPQEMRINRVTRAEGLETEENCSCSVCQVGHMSNIGHKYVKK